jgi:hypothetical protein
LVLCPQQLDLRPDSPESPNRTPRDDRCADGAHRIAADGRGGQLSESGDGGLAEGCRADHCDADGNADGDDGEGVITRGWVG